MESNYRDGYKLVWEEQFEGDSLNRDCWNVELHEPGWVNKEWQEYIDSEDVITVKDGKLYLTARKTIKEDGSAYYTSGRVSTQNKMDYTFGLFECRCKVPAGKGYLPAFWLMSTDETIYGQWPRCGEIDIMEVLGDQTKKLHGTMHFGNPHCQSQGTYELSEGHDFSEEFHTFAAKWEPGLIVWYVDGIEYHRETEWYSTTEGVGTLPFPKPFDNDFYIILNLAVGGEWVGYPDGTTKFDNPFVIDYVKVYQR